MRSTVGHTPKKGAGMTCARVLLMLALVLPVALWAVPAYASGQQFNRLQISNLPDSVLVTIQAAQPISMHQGRVQNRCVYFDLYGKLAANQSARKMAINSGGIVSAQYGWYKKSPPVIRVVVTTKGNRTCNVRYMDNKRTAVIRFDKAGYKPSKSPVAQESSARRMPAPTAIVAATRPVSTVSCPAKAVVSVSASAADDTPAPSAAPPLVVTEPSVAAASKPVLVASAAPIAMPMTTAQVLPVVAQQEKLISLDFVASDIHDVIKALSAQSGVNVVASPDVKGSVTVSLNKVTVDEALRLVANLSGYKFVEVDGTYVVGTADNLKALSAAGTVGAGDDKLTEVAVVKYSDAGMLSKMLEQQFGVVKVSSSAAPDSKEGAKSPVVLVLTGPAGMVRDAKAFVDKVEASVAANVAALVVEVYEVKYADSLELVGLLQSHVPGLKVTLGPTAGLKQQCPVGIEMSSTQGGGGATGGYSTAFEQAAKAPSRTIIMEGTSEEIARAREFLAKVDVQQAQIVIEAKVVDLNNDAAKDLGIQWTWPGNAGEQGSIDFSEIRYDEEGDPLSLNPLGHFRRVETQIMAKISALVRDGKAKVLANPSVSALDGKPASIFIGDEVKYVVNIQQTTTGQNVTVETAKVGVQLHAISRVSSDGYITMNLHPEVSVITDFLPTAGGLLLPEVSRRFVDSVIRVKNGETIVIGGLIKDEETEIVSGIPILKDLPIVGALFRNKSTNKTHSEVMMFITPKILPAAS